MSRGGARRPLRVEQALHLLPDVDALGPLRALVVSTSQTQVSAEPHQTVGKRYVQAKGLAELVPRAISQVTEHLAGLYEAAVAGLEAAEAGDLPGAVASLVRAGEREEGVGREAQARVWYDNALSIAEQLGDRQPETQTLYHLGRLEATRGTFEAAARFYQRSLVLAEAELDGAGAAMACGGLGDVAIAQHRWQGASSWFLRGIQHAGADRLLTAQMHLGLSDVARLGGRVDAANEALGRAQQIYDAAEDESGSIRVLNARGSLEALASHPAEALDNYREALARLQAGGRDPRLEMAIRLNICQTYLDWNRLPDAEDEIRRAEEVAIMHNFPRELARLYLILGKVRGLQGDEIGSVFFEKAIELSRTGDPWPQLEADAYIEYGLFREKLGEEEESRAYLERAREIIEGLGDGTKLAQVDAELARLHAG